MPVTSRENEAKQPGLWKFNRVETMYHKQRNNKICFIKKVKKKP